MRKVAFTYLIILILSSCFSDKSKDKEVDSEDWPIDARLADCDSFLESYQEWGNDYIEKLKKKLQPGKKFSKEKIIETPKEVVKWAERWYALEACVDHPKYQRRFEEISKEFQQKLRDLEVIGKKEEEK